MQVLIFKHNIEKKASGILRISRFSLTPIINLVQGLNTQVLKRSEDINVSAGYLFGIQMLVTEVLLLCQDDPPSVATWTK